MKQNVNRSWIEEAFVKARYPEKYNRFLKSVIESQEEMKRSDLEDIEAIRKLIPLSPLQNRVLDDIEFLCRLDIFGGWETPDFWKMQDEWLEEHPNNISCEERVAALLPIMEKPDIPDKLKETMWRGLFLFNDYFADDYTPPIN